MDSVENNAGTFDPMDNVVTITNIKFHCKNEGEREGLPTDFTVNVPKNLRSLATTDRQKFEDELESFVYRFLYQMFKREVTHCQIYY